MEYGDAKNREIVIALDYLITSKTDSWRLEFCRNVEDIINEYTMVKEKMISELIELERIRGIVWENYSEVDELFGSGLTVKTKIYDEKKDNYLDVQIYYFTHQEISKNGNYYEFIFDSIAK